MTYKELSPQEVAKMLGENPNGFDAYVRNCETDKWEKRTVVGVSYNKPYPIFSESEFCYAYCAISIPDTYEPYPDDEMPNLKRLDGVICIKSGTEDTITTIGKDGRVRLGCYGWQSNQTLFDDFTHLDGSPIGRKVGE